VYLSIGVEDVEILYY